VEAEQTNGSHDSAASGVRSHPCVSQIPAPLAELVDATDFSSSAPGMARTSQAPLSVRTSRFDSERVHQNSSMVVRPRQRRERFKSSGSGELGSALVPEGPFDSWLCLNLFDPV
jgi:hypothetical protein